jgi:pimeloyl-ACP methyl ester carboxylesterase
VPLPYLLVGHSLGCHIVRVFAARHPDQVTGLVLVDARCETLAPALPQTFLRRAAELMPYDVAQAAQADELVSGLPDPGQVPVSVITHGRADWIHEIFGLDAAELDQAEQAWQRHQRHLVARFENARFRVASHSGHMIPLDEPELVASEIRSMIKTAS